MQYFTLHAPCSAPLLFCVWPQQPAEQKSVVANNVANDTTDYDAAAKIPIVTFADLSPATQRHTAHLVCLHAATVTVTLSPLLDPGGPYTPRRSSGGG